jgi:ribosomal protein S12 methylthiotransferase accessory factor
VDPIYSAALGAFAPLVDARTGLISSVDLLKLDVRDPEVYMANAEPCDTIALNGLSAANRGAACSTTPERAIVRACGESIERYCSAIYDPCSLFLASEFDMRRAGMDFISVHDVYPFAAWQYDDDFPYQRVNDRKLRWVCGSSIATGGDVWLPASCVYVPYLFDAAVEPFTHMPISTGLAAGPTVEACIGKGIFEIIERDALMLVWYKRLRVPRIDIESCYGISPDIDRLLSAQRQDGPTWYVSLLTLDIEVPVICAALIDPGPRPLTSFGIAAHSDAEHALLLALEEAALTRVLLHRSEELRDPSYVHEDYSTLRGHLLGHATSAELRERMRFMTDEGPIVSFADVAEAHPESIAVSDGLLEHGFEPAWVDITTDDIRDFPLRVVRTVIPGMQPLDNDHRYRFLGGSRLDSTAGGLPTTIGTPNSDPHPFP